MGRRSLKGLVLSAALRNDGDKKPLGRQFSHSVEHPNVPERGSTMKMFVWRHSKKLSSWSMFDEPHIYRDNYLRAEVSVLADSLEEALQWLESSGEWNIEELRRIEPRVVAADQPGIVWKSIDFG